MKKFFVFLVLATCFANFCFAQSSLENIQVYKAIEMAKDVNLKRSGITDPDKIWPGQIVWVPVSANLGDSEWKIVEKVLFPPITQPIPMVTEPKSTAVPVIPGTEENDSGFWNFLSATPWWVWLIVILITLGMIINSHLESQKNPVTAGPPQIPGGVNDTRAYSRMNEIAQDRFPGARLDIKNIRRGTLSGHAIVHYAEGKTKKLKLNNVAAYAGEIMINNQLETIYFLQGCGNDAQEGDYMYGDELVFTPVVVINQDGSESPLPQEQGNSAVVEETKALEKTEEKQPVVIAETTGTESFQIVMKILDIHKETVKDGVHSSSIEWNPSSGLKTAVNYNFKTPQGQAKKNEDAERK
jgi:hypothetical protein